MQKSFTQFALCMAMVALSLSSWGQITIERQNYPRGADFIDTLVRALPGSISLPSEGPAQVWDYSSLTEDETILIQYSDASDDPDFPGALNVREIPLSFQVFNIPAVRYERINEDSWWEAGRLLGDVTYPIASITGSPSDSLRFVGGPQPFVGQSDLLKFPLNYLDEWTGGHVETTNFELTVAGFGLNQVPGQRKRVLTMNRNVVAYGELTIPTSDGSPSSPMDVLMIKVIQTVQDSIFLGGAPAPPQLMAAFGLTQGSIVADSFYVFYRLDFGFPVMNVNMVNPVTAVYRPAAANVLTTSVQELNLTSVRSFPNPIQAGQVLTLQTETPLGAGLVSLFDLSGRLVHRTQFDGSLPQIQIGIPANLSAGVYSYLLSDLQGDLIGNGKLLVE